MCRTCSSAGDLQGQRGGHPADAAAQFAQVEQFLTVAQDRPAAVGPDVAAGKVQQRGLAGAVGAEDRPVLPRLTRQVMASRMTRSSASQVTS